MIKLRGLCGHQSNHIRSQYPQSHRMDPERPLLDNDRVWTNLDGPGITKYSIGIWSIDNCFIWWYSSFGRIQIRYRVNLLYPCSVVYHVITFEIAPPPSPFCPFTTLFNEILSDPNISIDLFAIDTLYFLETQNAFK